MAEQMQDVQLEHTYSSYVKNRDLALRTCQRRWTIGRSGERGSGISVWAARHDDENVSVLYIIHTDRGTTHKSVYTALSAEIVEYTNFISAEGNPSPNECPLAQLAGAVEHIDCITAEGWDPRTSVLWPSWLGM